MPINLSVDEKKNLIDSLLSCPSLANQQTRQDLINDLSPMIRDNIRESPAARPHIVQLVNTCLNFLEGMPQLLKQLELYEGASFPMRHVLVTWSAILAQRVKAALQQQQWSQVIEWGQQLVAFEVAHHLNEKTAEAQAALGIAQAKLAAIPSIVPDPPQVNLTPRQYVDSPLSGQVKTTVIPMWVGFGLVGLVGIVGIVLIGVGLLWTVNMGGGRVPIATTGQAQSVTLTNTSSSIATNIPPTNIPILPTVTLLGKSKI